MGFGLGRVQVPSVVPPERETMLLQIMNDVSRTAPTGNATKRCDLCGGERFELIAHYDRHGDPLATTMCLDCGLVCHAQIPSDQQLAEFYACQYRRAYHGETIPSPRRVMRA